MFKIKNLKKNIKYNYKMADETTTLDLTDNGENNSEEEAARVAAEEEAAEKDKEDVDDSDDLICSLKTLTEVLYLWSSQIILRGEVEKSLKEDKFKDDNLDNIEKVIDLIKKWNNMGPGFCKNYSVKNIDEHTLEGESKNLSEERKKEVLKTLTQFVIDVSLKKIQVKDINEYLNNI